MRRSIHTKSKAHSPVKVVASKNNAALSIEFGSMAHPELMQSAPLFIGIFASIAFLVVQALVIIIYYLLMRRENHAPTNILTPEPILD